MSTLRIPEGSGKMIFNQGVKCSNAYILNMQSPNFHFTKKVSILGKANLKIFLNITLILTLVISHSNILSSVFQLFPTDGSNSAFILIFYRKKFSQIINVFWIHLI